MNKKILLLVGIVVLLLSGSGGALIDLTGTYQGAYSYAEGWYHNHPGASINFVQDTYYHLIFNTSTHLNGFTFDGDANLTCTKAGLYSVNFQAVGSGVNNHIYYLRVGINGVVQNNTGVHKKLTAGGDILTMTGTGFIDLINGDKVSLMIVDVTGNGAGTYYGSNLNLVWIGD